MLALTISEVHFDPVLNARTDHRDQYVELSGPAGGTIADGTYLVVVEGDAVNPGDIHTVFDLSGQTLGSNGYFVIAQAGHGYTIDASANVLQGTTVGFGGLPDGVFQDDSTISENIDFIFGANSFYLIESATPPLLTDDIDTNNDGVTDGIFSNWTVLDSFGVLRGNATSLAYGQIVFRQGGVGNAPAGATVIDVQALSYVARASRSSGWEPDDWIAGNTIERNNDDFEFRFTHGTFGTPVPTAYAGRDLDHLGAPNFFAGVSGTVFQDHDGDGTIDEGEPPLQNVPLLADLDDDGVRDGFTVRIEPDDFAVGAELTNVSPYATLTIADRTHTILGFLVEPFEQPILASTGSKTFSHEGIGFTNIDRQVRVDFYEAVSAVSVDAIGNSDLIDTYGRLEAFGADGESLEFVRSPALGRADKATLSINRGTPDIAFAVFYSDEDFLESSSFGIFDHLTFRVAEPVTTSDADGQYEFNQLPPASYQIRATLPAGTAQTFPAPPGIHHVNLAGTTHVDGLHFGGRPNGVPQIEDQQFTVREDASVGTAVGIVAATDPDVGQSLTYSIVGGTGSDVFEIEEDTGTLRVKTPAALDFESLTSFTVDVQVSDNLVPPLTETATMTIEVTNANDAPTIGEAVFEVDENASAGTVLGNVPGMDEDSGLDGQLTYSIASGNAENAFSIHPETGEITLSQTAALDFERRASYEVTFRVTDQAVPPLSITRRLPIMVRDVNEPPTIAAVTIEVDENTLAGVAVGSLSASDPDADQQLTWTITGGSGDGHFEIDPASGELTVEADATLNFEQQSTYLLEVRVEDDGTPRRSAVETITVQIIDLNEPPHFPPVTFDVNENVGPNTLLGSVVATDPDDGQSVTYSIVGGTGEALFRVDANSGEVRVGPAAGIDFEQATAFTLDVRATDTGTPSQSRTTSVGILINDINEPPNPESLSITLDEHPAVNTVVGTVNAGDPDANDTFTYTFDDPTGPAAAFRLTAEGQLLVEQSDLLDFEAVESLSFQVHVRDEAGLEGSANVTIRLRDRNEFDPTIASQTFTVAEDVAAASQIGVLQASDEDLKQALFFRLIGGDPEGLFTVSLTQGTLRLATGKTLDHEVASIHELTIEVTDSGTPARTSAAQVTVEVIDVNEAPVLTGSLPDEEYRANVEAVFSLPDDFVVDPDVNESFLYSATQADSTPLPAWIEFNTTEKQFRVTAGEAAVGILEIELTITDRAGAGLSVSDVFRVTIVSNPAPNRNPVEVHDVTGDGETVPGDALVLINTLNKIGPGKLPDLRLMGTQFFLDPSGDNLLTSNDVLRVINFLNARPRGEGEGSPWISERRTSFALPPSLTDSTDIPLEGSPRAAFHHVPPRNALSFEDPNDDVDDLDVAMLELLEDALAIRADR